MYAREGSVLAGRIAALVDVTSRLPEQVWYEAEQTAQDQRFWERALARVRRGTLLLFDLGFLNFVRFDQLTEAGVGWLVWC